MYSNNSEFSRVHDNFKCPEEKNLETYRMHLVIFVKLYGFKYSYLIQIILWFQVILLSKSFVCTLLLFQVADNNNP